MHPDITDSYIRALNKIIVTERDKESGWFKLTVFDIEGRV